jgi:hypothetical protein
MDGPEGSNHPLVGARIAGTLFGPQYYDLCLLRSRHFAKRAGRDPSKLCWADKLSHKYYPVWLYLLLSRATSELKEYRLNSELAQFISITESDANWFRAIRARMVAVAYTQNPRNMSIGLDIGE